MMLSLRIISRLLDYPNEELWLHIHELAEAVSECSELTEQQRQTLNSWIDEYRQQSLFDAQAQYCALFDRGRALSLLLFEHVHGQSRDRGQAMIDLLEQYQTAGLQLNAKELPDHLPLYLEYLAIVPQAEAIQGLDDIVPILSLLAERLNHRQSRYAFLMTLLLELASIDVNLAPIVDKVRQEPRDDTPQALDQVWEEEQVTFMDNADCDSQTKHHQRRFADRIQPQYLDVSQLAGGQ
ncbi:nitrate reductase molybdenum cofactor assembly chaperone [Vibrio palustris]|uniref:Nitrate reductase molybdenum cofactor assembly chaperone NarJ n=1 Tax=Vibrio palustris TaxID=1918946 RepID=A0A1R4B151_9VIBR|nr:nitrate reductase molybdenum cofactor assembly chaperone [Vibrio palustris]SJL82607.1 Nitrate reductase molybdenum cofactor assembly chaperone NarJ [Vibrio palustris]